MSKQTIISKAKELARLEREYLELSYETKKPGNQEEVVEYISELMRICARAFELKNDVQLLLREMPNINVQDPEIEKLLRDIRNDEKFYSVSQYERMASAFNEVSHDPNDSWDIDANDFIRNHPEAFNDFHCDIDYVGYFTGSMRVGTLISRRKIPEAGLAYFHEIRESFAFCLYRSSIALCRAMLESVYFETLKNRRNYLNPDQSKIIKIDLAKEDKLFRMIKDAFKMRIIDYDTKEDSFFVKNQSNTMVLHAKDEKHEITEDLAFEVITKTINVVERLYEK